MNVTNVATGRPQKITTRLYTLPPCNTTSFPVKLIAIHFFCFYFKIYLFSCYIKYLILNMNNILRKRAIKGVLTKFISLHHAWFYLFKRFAKLFMI